MNPSDRLEQQLPDLLDELALPRIPDYVDDMLRQAAATRQLPAWASLERWLPMGTLARPAPLGLPSWQPILLLVALLLAAIVGGVLLIGSQPRYPAPFGPARNGQLLASTLDGSLVAIDPASRTVTPHGDDGDRYYPWYSPDGTRLLFLAKELGTDPRSGRPVEALFVANADGTGARELLSGGGGTIDWVEWSPAGDQVLVLHTAGGQDAYLFDVETTKERRLDFGMELSNAYFLPSGKEIVFIGATPFPTTTWAYYVSSLEDPDPRPLTPVTGNQVSGGTLTPNGTTWVYSKWDTPKGIAGRLHAIDIASGEERPLDVAGYGPGVADLNPLISPDGQTILVHRFTEGAMSAHVLVRADGSGQPVQLTPGPNLRSNETPERLFSPDGSMVVVRYTENNSAWIYDAKTGEGREVSGATLDGMSWQRTAP